MEFVGLAGETDFDGWRAAARQLLLADVRPEEVTWSVGHDRSLLGARASGIVLSQGGQRFAVPRGFIEHARAALLIRDPDRFGFLYRVLWRMRHETGLFEIAVDPDIRRLDTMVKSVHRDLHKMKAYVRFREVTVPDSAGSRPRPSQVERALRDGDHFNVMSPWFIAWFEPSHFIVEAVAPFFVRRFAGMNWAILTPDASASWDGEALTLGPGASRSEAPDDDALEDLWRSYYANIFNPARLKLATMQGHMPKKYWRNLPEAELIAPLAAAAHRRRQDMIDAPSTDEPERAERVRVAAGHRQTKERPLLASSTLADVASAARDCTACDLYKDATQTVFGEGPANARIVFVGEQPGDQEDLAGHPFVGPAGKLFDRALVEAGIVRDTVYVTNAVKHFKFIVRGKRRMHQSPKVTEIRACRPWLEAEFERLEPDLVVALGASAANSLFGRPTPIEKNRRTFFKQTLGGRERRVLVTVHPSYLLRLPDEEAKALEYAKFVEDLRLAGGAIGSD